MRPSVQARRRKLLAAFAIGALAAVVLIAVAQLLNRRSAPDVVPNPVVHLAGIPQEGTTLGSPSARVRLIEYADQQCPGCRSYTLTIFPLLVNEYVRSGKVKMQYLGFPFIGSDSHKALRFLLAAGRQNRLWQLQEALYRHQGVENSGWVTDELIREQASQIQGLNVNKLFEDAGGAAIAQEADAQLKAAEDAGIPGTPAFFIGIGKAAPYAINVSNVDDFRAALDDALKG